MTHVGYSARVEALDVLVELLSGLDHDAEFGRGEFYDRCCEALCRLTTMRRAGLMLYDDARKLVLPAGSHGVDPALLRQIYGTLEETPIAQRALAADTVVEASEGLEAELPARYARFAGIATIQQARARLLSERIDLAREVHERVMQRLFGVSLVVGSEHELSADERKRSAEEIRAALADLRSALSRPLAPSIRGTGAALREELERLGRHYKQLPLDVTWELDGRLPADLEPLAQSVLAEALRNADKHARPSRVRVRVSRVDGTFTLEVRNDGVRVGGPRSTGMGLRLAAFEALQRGGVVEFGPEEGDHWRGAPVGAARLGGAPRSPRV